MQILATVWPYWQPLATVFAGCAALTGALIALRGVRLTLNHNWERLRKEQVEKLAKDRLIALQALYGDFFTAAADYLIQTGTLEDTEKRIAAWVVADKAKKDDPVFGMWHESDKATLVSIRQDRKKNHAAMNSAISRLFIMQADPLHLTIAKQCFFAVNKVVEKSDPKGREDLRVVLRERAADVGKGLETQYLQEMGHLPRVIREDDVV